MRRRNVTLWIAQVALSCLFLFAGGMKLVVPSEALAMPVPLPAGFLRLIGVAEVFGAVGLVLPGLLRIHEELTPLAASGLVIIMAGATVITALGGTIAPAVVPLLLGVVAAAIAFSRRQAIVIE